MKKLFLVLAIGAFVSCNDDAEGTGTTTDTVNTSTDTTLLSPPVDTTYRDTTARPDSTIRK